MDFICCISTAACCRMRDAAMDFSLQMTVYPPRSCNTLLTTPWSTLMQVSLIKQKSDLNVQFRKLLVESHTKQTELGLDVPFGTHCKPMEQLFGVLCHSECDTRMSQ